MKCEFCEQEIPDNSEFCPECYCLLKDTDEALVAQSEALAQKIPFESPEAAEPDIPRSTYWKVAVALSILFAIAIFVLLANFIRGKVPAAISVPFFIAFVISAILNIALFLGIDANKTKIQKLEKRIKKLENMNQYDDMKD